MTAAGNCAHCDKPLTEPWMTARRPDVVQVKVHAGCYKAFRRTEVSA